MARHAKNGQLKARHGTRDEVIRNGNIKAGGKKAAEKQETGNANVSKAVALSLVDYSLMLSLVFGGCCSLVCFGTSMLKVTNLDESAMQKCLVVRATIEDGCTHRYGDSPTFKSHRRVGILTPRRDNPHLLSDAIHNTTITSILLVLSQGGRFAAPQASTCAPQ